MRFTAGAPSLEAAPAKRALVSPAAFIPVPLSQSVPVRRRVVLWLGERRRVVLSACVFELAHQGFGLDVSVPTFRLSTDAFECSHLLSPPSKLVVQGIASAVPILQSGRYRGGTKVK